MSRRAFAEDLLSERNEDDEGTPWPRRDRGRPLFDTAIIYRRDRQLAYIQEPG